VVEFVVAVGAVVAFLGTVVTGVGAVVTLGVVSLDIVVGVADTIVGAGVNIFAVGTMDELVILASSFMCSGVTIGMRKERRKGARNRR